MLGLDVDEEVIGCAGRQAIFPRPEQVAAYDGEQEHGGDADADGHRLTRRELRVAGEVGQAEAPRRSRPQTKAGHDANRAEGESGQRRYGDQRSAEHIENQLEVAGRGGDQKGQRHGGRGIERPQPRRQAAQIAAQHAQRRHVAQPQHRR